MTKNKTTVAICDSDFNEIGLLSLTTNKTKEQFRLKLRHGDMAPLRWKDIRKTDEGEVLFVPSMQKTKHPVIVPLGQ